MARPKGKLFALLAVFAAIGLVAASGAFTTVEADRTAEVNVAGDDAALLAIAPNASSPNGDGAYARTQGGQFQLVLNDSVNPGQGGSGLNPDATTEINHVFNVTNQGTQSVDVGVSITVNGDSGISVGSGQSAPNIYLYSGDDTGTDLTSGTVTLSQGETQSMSVYIDTTGLSDSDSLDLTITISANA
jgi:hypothetical protein